MKILPIHLKDFVHDLSFNKINLLLENIYSGISSLQISHSKTEFHFGIESILIQTISTWIKQNKNPNWISYIQPVSENSHDASDPKPQLEKIITTDWGYVLLALLYRSEGNFLRSDHSSISKDEIYPFLTKRYNKLRKPIYQRNMEEVGPQKTAPERSPAMRGPKISQIFIDPSNYKLTSFYYGSGELKEHSEIQYVLANIVNEFHYFKSIYTAKNKSISSLLTDFSNIFYELIENTEKWGCRDFHGNRALGARGFMIYEHRQIPEIAESSPLQRFCKGKAYLEITIFDTGLGLAQHWTKNEIKNLTLEEEYRACWKCFNSHFKTGDGKGLKRFIYTLNQRNGYFHVRTGRLLLYYSAKDNLIEGDIELLDYTNQGTTLTELPFIQGTSYTILLPLEEL